MRTRLSEDFFPGFIPHITDEHKTRQGPAAQAPMGPGRASLSPSCSALWQRLAEGFWGLGLSPRARQHTEDGCSARHQWQGAGAGRGVVEQGQTGQTGSYAPIYGHLSFCIHIPIKVEPGHDSPHLGGSVHPAQLSPSPFHHPAAAAKLLAGAVTLPEPASLPCWHRLTSSSLQSFSPDRDTPCHLFL